LAEIVRNVHSIEKGLCIENPRLGFGVKKIHVMFDLVDEYIAKGYDKSSPVLKMVLSSLNDYIVFHEEKSFHSNETDEIKNKISELATVLGADRNIKYGGCLGSENIKIFGSVDNVSLKDVLFNRHSIRKFSKTPISEHDLMAAINMANRCPSACNRQTTRVYIIGKEKIDILKEWLDGIGGFVDSVDKFLIVTGKTSAFNDGEIYQHIVNSSIFTGYLSLCLTAYNIGNCVVQRPLLYSRKWRKFAKENGIPGDENIVCMMAVGNYEDNFKVPVSYRMPVEMIARTL
jgi:nitroreductase